MILDAGKVRSLLSYNAKTGQLFWKKRLSNRVNIGDAAGGIYGTGYVYIGINSVSYKAHRIIWLLKTGHWPKCDIDHKNGKRADNRWANLREATSTQNKMNVGRKINNTSGFKGVSRHAKSGKWRARIRIEGKETALGLYTCARKAHLAYVAAAKKHFGEFARAR